MQPVAGLYVRTVNQQHGFVTANAAVPYEGLPLGSKVRVLPNHSCITAAAHDAYYVIDGGTQVIHTWPRCNGW